jgi:hypothetical protein
MGRGKHCFLSAAKRHQIVEMLGLGIGVKEITEKVGCSVETVYRARKRLQAG